MNINNAFYYYISEIKERLIDDNQIMATTDTDNITIKNQKVLFDGLIINLSQRTHQIDEDE